MQLNDSLLVGLGRGAVIAGEDYDQHLRIREFSKSIGFVVDAGQILGLVGPNGAGKTTTLRTLAGIIPPSRGKLTVAGHDVQQEPVAAKRALGYISEARMPRQPL